jgi:leucyl/phenylalanyl-tRNA--protein transferase
MKQLTPEIVLSAYASGVFPMAESADTPTLFWVDPERRGILPLDRFHIPKRLARTVRADRFEVHVDRAFREVVQGCAEATPDRPSTWINGEIYRLFVDLFERGAAHSVECWHGDALVGGLYGVSLGGAFFGESMFSRERDASKVALVHLVARMIAGGYTLLDTQFVTTHLSGFGAIEVPRTVYHRLLGQALSIRGNFLKLPAHIPGAIALQSITQTS